MNEKKIAIQNFQTNSHPGGGTQLSSWYECAAQRAENRGLEKGLPQIWGLKEPIFLSEALGTEI